MSNATQSLLKKTTKEWPTNYWLITPWNIVAFFSTLALTKWICGVIGPAACRSTWGNLKLSGIMFLSATVATVFIMMGSALFKVKEEEMNDAFLWTGTWVMIGLAGCVVFFGRAILILVGMLNPGATPPQFLEWLFNPMTLQWLEKVGNP